MKKILIPGIALALVLVAAGFTTMPVQKATAVHTTITNAAAIDVVSSGAETIDDDGQIEVDCSEDFLLWDMFIDATIDDNAGAMDIDSIEIDEIAIGTAAAGTTITDIEVFDAEVQG